MTERSDAELNTKAKFPMDRFFHVANQGWFFYWRSCGRGFPTANVGGFMSRRNAIAAFKDATSDFAAPFTMDNYVFNMTYQTGNYS